MRDFKQSAAVGSVCTKLTEPPRVSSPAYPERWDGQGACYVPRLPLGPRWGPQPPGAAVPRCCPDHLVI